MNGTDSVSRLTYLTARVRNSEAPIAFHWSVSREVLCHKASPWDVVAQPPRRAVISAGRCHRRPFLSWPDPFEPGQLFRSFLLKTEIECLPRPAVRLREYCVVSLLDEERHLRRHLHSLLSNVESTVVEWKELLDILSQIALPVQASGRTVQCLSVVFTGTEELQGG